MTDNSNGNSNGHGKLIEKIRKLIALSESPNEHEAALAAKRVHALLAQHNLSMSDVTVGVTEEDFHIGGDLTMWSEPWPRLLAGIVAKMYFCSHFYKRMPTHYDRHWFVGAQYNLVVASEMFKYLSSAIERLAVEGARRQIHVWGRSRKGVTSDQRVIYRAKYLSSFKYACSVRLYYRIQERIEEAKRGQVIKTESGTTLPALADMYERTDRQLREFLNKKIGQIDEVECAESVIMKSEAGTADGHAAGERIGLDTQIGKSSGHLIAPLRRVVIERNAFGRPIRTARLRIGAEMRILEAGLAKVKASRGEPPPGAPPSGGLAGLTPFGGYNKITPEAWAEHDAAMARWQERRVFASFWPNWSKPLHRFRGILAGWGA